MTIFAEVSENEFIRDTLCQKRYNLLDSVRYLANGKRQNVS